jgi:hypothetical protein
MLDGVSKCVYRCGGGLTAGLVAVVGSTIFAHKVEDALVDRFGAPAHSQHGQLKQTEREAHVSQLCMPSEGSDYTETNG